MWLLGEIHPIYGEVTACGVKDGCPWRMFIKNKVVSLVNLSDLKEYS